MRFIRQLTKGQWAYALVACVLLSLIASVLAASRAHPTASVSDDIESIPGLIAYYPLGESSGTTLADAGPNHLDGACTGVLADQPGSIGPSYSFDGTQSYCAVPDSKALSPTTGFTAFALVNLRDLNTLQSVFGKSAYDKSGFRVYTTAAGKVAFDVVTAAGEQLLSTTFPAANRWVFLAVTYDRYNQVIYINGQEVKAQVGNSTFGGISRYNDVFSDAQGMRAYPWGFEAQKGHTTNTFAHDGTISMSSDNDANATLFALPDLNDKPVVVPGKSYTQSFDVKYAITSGQGIRVIHQWFNSTAPNTAPFHTDYGPFVKGTSNWTALSLAATAPPGAVRGDIVLELWGTGTVEARNPQFYLTNAADAAVTANAQPFLLGQTTGDAWRMNGSLQHVAIFNRALSENELLSLALTFASHSDQHSHG